MEMQSIREFVQYLELFEDSLVEPDPTTMKMIDESRQTLISHLSLEELHELHRIREKIRFLYGGKK